MPVGRLIFLLLGFLTPFFYTNNVVKYVGISGVYFSLLETLLTTIIAVVLLH